MLESRRIGELWMDLERGAVLVKRLRMHNLVLEILLGIA